MTQVVKIDKPIKNYLMDFGLTEKEVKLYLALLKTGPNTIMNLARETGIKRSTTHNNVEELIKKGLVSQTNYGERRMVVAEDPGKLSFLLEQKKWDMKKLEDNMTEIVGMIKQSVPENEKNTNIEVKYYEGADKVRLVYEETSSADKVYSFANLEKYYELFAEPIGIQKKALEKHMNREVWDILADSPKARKVIDSNQKGYHAKLVASEVFDSGFDFLIYDEKVAIMQLEKNNPAAIVINSKPISEGLRALHKAMWKLLQ